MHFAQIKNPYPDITNPCGTTKIDATDCDPVTITPTVGSEAFNLTPGKYMYLNGYEILITSPSEGLLYLPLIQSRIPVEWSGLTVMASEDGIYGCVTEGEARMQGSVTGAIGRDLHRQVMALLTQGAGSFSGKFGEALENLKIKATELKTKSGITQTDWTTLNSYIVASKSGFTEWKGSISNAFGNDIPEEVQTALTRLGEIEEELAQLSACATENIPQGGGGDNYLNFTAMLRLACAMQFDKLIAKQGEAGELALFLEEVLDPESIWGVPSGTVSYGRCFFDENKVTADIARKFPDNGSLKEGFRIRVRGKTLLPGAIEAVPCYEMRYWYDGEPGTRNNRGFYASEAYGEKVLTYHRALVFLANTEVLKCPQHLRANYQSSQAQIWDSFTGSRTFSNDGDYFAEAISDFSDDHIRFWQSRLDCIGISPSYIEYEVAELLASLGMGTIARQGFKKIAKNYALKKGWKVTIEAGEEILDNIFKLQKDEFLKYVDNIVTLSSNRKGAWGEIASDVFLQEKGYIALHSRKTAITQGWGESGIDAVFKKNGVYYIVEAKYKGYATLKTLADGTKQMSDGWILGNDRLLNAVGRNQAIYDDIFNSGYKRLLAETAPNGSVIYKELDSNASVIGTFTP